MRASFRPSELTQDDLSRIKKVISSNFGINFEEQSHSLLALGINERMNAMGMESAAEYIDFTVGAYGYRELNKLVDIITIKETSFFRNQAHFDALKSCVFPELAKNNDCDGSGIRLWSAGCSTGEEPYSLAIQLLECGLGSSARIVATDLSSQAIQSAKSGSYGPNSVSSLPGSLLTRYFRTTDEGFEISEEIKSMVDFRIHNLAERYYLEWLSGFDVVFCQNVTIYFSQETTRRVMSNIYKSMKPGGYLFIGFSETLWKIMDEFEMVGLGRTYAYRKPQAAVPRNLKQSSKQIQPPGRQKDDSSSESALDFDKVIEDLLIQRKYDEAVRKCESMLKSDFLSTKARFLLAVVYGEMGLTGLSTEELRKVIFLDSDNVEAHLLLGSLCMRLGDHEKARRAYNASIRILRTKPDDFLVGGFPAKVVIEACSRHLSELTAL